ncbi:MAG TPA: penicillin-binding protein 1B, partial [Gammaproteobacteria bacterium]
MPRKSSNSKSTQSKPSNGKSKLSWLFNRYSLIGLAAFSVLFIFYVIYLDSQIRSRFEGRIWSLPSQVYARPLELYSGYGISVQQLERELELIGYKKVEKLPTSPGQYRQWNNRHFEIITREFRLWDGAQKSQSLKLEIVNNKIVSLSSLYNQTDIPLVRFEPLRIGGIYPNQGEDR